MSIKQQFTCTFEEVMLDWAIAEILSPTISKRRYAACPKHLQKLLRTRQFDALTLADRAALIQTVRIVRKTLIDSNGVTPSARYWRKRLCVDELLDFSILPQFGCGAIALREFAAKIKCSPSSRVEYEMHASALEMLQLVRRGCPLLGRPIAVSRRKPLPPLLIEGYKRAMVAIWAKKSSIELYVCEP